jgi:hypothetical protein
MPRARINDATEDAVLPKTRARKPRAVSVTAETSAPRKRVTPRPRVAEISHEVAPRKAPTPLSQQRRSRSKKTKTFFGVIVFCMVLGGAGVTVGVMDKGSIDVVAVVNERNEKINKGEVRDDSGNTITQTLQVQSDTRPNGGLPMGEAVDQPPVAPQVSSTTEATTTVDTATTTEATDTATTSEESV